MRLIIAMLAASISTAAFAQTAQAPTCADNKLIIGSGTPKGAYAQVMKPLAARCQMICEDDKTTQGGFDNVTKLIRNEFDGGIAQVDTLQLLSRNYPALKDGVRSLFPLHGSSMHIVAMSAGFPVVTESTSKSGGIWGLGASDVVVKNRANVPINTLQDLKGKPIAAWSSAATTMEIVNNRLNLGMQITEVPNREVGLGMLKEGKVAAFVGAGGFPLDWIEKPNGQAADGIKDMVLVDVDDRTISGLDKPYYGVKVIYRSIGAIGLNTISVRNEMIVRDIQDGDRAAAIQEFRTCFQQNLRAIKSSRGVHPAWADITGSMETSWAPYQSAGSSLPAALPVEAPRRHR